MSDHISKREILSRLSAECERSGSIRKFAKERGISPGHLSDTLAGKRDVSTTMAVAVGYVPVTMFVPYRMVG